MERKKYVVIGEAPESDSEEELNVTLAQTRKSSSSGDAANSQGIVVAGEAPESDEEGDKRSVSSVSSATSVSSSTFALNKKNTVYGKAKKQETTKYNSLLHRKLRERNISLHKNVVEFLYNTANNAARDMHVANQQLLRSQLQLQEASLSLHTLQANLSQFHNKLAAATSAPFLPRINVPNKLV